MTRSSNKSSLTSNKEELCSRGETSRLFSSSTPAPDPSSTSSSLFYSKTNTTMSRLMLDKISASDFYGEYSGHRVEHLEVLLPRLREVSDSVIWTAGDSSLDNKYWFNDKREAVGVYKDVLEPPRSVCDVTFWLNSLLEAERQDPQQHHQRQDNGSGETRPPRRVALNAAVEASTLGERTFQLRLQDIFLRDHIREDDILIVSVGGNDVALAPSPCTIISMLGLLSLPLKCIENTTSCCSLCCGGDRTGSSTACPCDDCCCGCGFSFLSCFGTCPPCAGYFFHLFGTRVQSYIQQLTSKTKPKQILVCMIYYPDETLVPSWANTALGALGYNSNPRKLQTMIRRTFELATSNIRMPGGGQDHNHHTQVIPVPLFHVLDGTCSHDYVARVEPSASGGRKMAEFLLNIIQTNNNTDNNNNNNNNNSPSFTMSHPPTTDYMQDRS